MKKPNPSDHEPSLPLDPQKCRHLLNLLKGLNKPDFRDKPDEKRSFRASAIKVFVFKYLFQASTLSIEFVITFRRC